MKLLIYDWTFITKKDLYHTLDIQKIDYDLFHSGASPRIDSQREEFRKNVAVALEKKKYDAIFSVNFYEDLAYAANNKDILYICWTYDSPALGMLRPCHKLDTNRIFIFDSYEYSTFKEQGVPHIYYMPLAVDVQKLNNMRPSPQQQLKYRSDISFVGQLYQSDMDKIFPLFDEYSAGYVAAIINTQLNTYGSYIIDDLVNDHVINELCNEQVKQALLKNINDRFLHDVNELRSYGFNMFLAKAVTNKERVLLLTLLARYFNVKHYAPGKANMPNVKECGVIDYETTMPLVFKCSRINLNITLRTIRHGIPQRVIDILGCHALALTNYQPDLLEYFEDEKNILIYSSLEEALDKCKYYLSHDKEAEQIRNNGYKIVKDQFNYACQLDKIWKLSGIVGTI